MKKMKERLTPILKIVLVVVLITGYFFFVHYDEFHKRKQGRPSPKEIVVTS